MASGVRIPTYQNVQRLPAAPNALPSTRMTAAPTAAALGGNARLPTDHIGAGLRSAGEDFAKVGAVMQEREDTRLLFERETLLKDDLRKRQADWAERRGVNAVGVTDEVAKYYDEASSKYGEGLNDRQRRIWDQTVAKHRAHSLDSFAVHEARERSVALEESAKANIVSSIGFAVDNVDNPDAISTAAADIDDRVQVMAALNGWSSARTQIERQNYQTKLHEQVLARLADTDPDRAAAYLDEHADSIDPVVVTKLRKGVEAATATARAQSFADEVMAEGLSEADAIAKARRELSGEAEQRTVQEIKTRHAEIHAARERQQRAALDEAMQHYARGGINAIPPSLWAEMDGKDQINLLDFASKRAERIANRHSKNPEVRAAAREQERLTYERLRTYAEEDPEGFADVDLIAEGAALANSDFNKLRATQEAIRSGTYRSAADNAWKAAVNELGISGTSDKRVKKREKLRRAYDSEVARFRADNNREPNERERAAIIDSLIVSGTVPGWLWDSEMKRYEAINKGQGDAFRPDSAVSDDTAPRQDLPRPQSQAEYDALPSGARYVHPDGDIRMKK